MKLLFYEKMNILFDSYVCCVTQSIQILCFVLLHNHHHLIIYTQAKVTIVRKDEQPLCMLSVT